MKHQIITAGQAPVRAKVPGLPKSIALRMELAMVQHMARERGKGKLPPGKENTRGPIPQHKRKVLAALREHGPISARELAPLVEGLSRSRISYARSDLRIDGLVKSTGGGSKYKWEAVE